MIDKLKKQKPAGIKKMLFFAGLIGIILFFSGCIQTQEYVYEDEVFKPAEEQEKISTAAEVKEGKKWPDYFFEKNNLVRQCPVCKRRYKASVASCPYDGASLKAAAGESPQGN